MIQVIQMCLALFGDFIYYTFGGGGLFDMRCDLILALCSALCCVAVIRLFWRLFD